jgi:hypothetical protein
MNHPKGKKKFIFKMSLTLGRGEFTLKGHGVALATPN